MDVVVRSENQLGNYDAMCTAIAECHKVDEVAEMRNQARAMEVYAKQAMNFEAERQAIEVRIRAERRAGQLLSGMERNQGANNQYALGDNEPKHSEFKQAKLDSGISDNQGKRWQKLADIPENEFESRINSSLMPSTSGLIRDNSQMPKADKPMDSEAIKLWGSLRDFNNDISTDNLPYLLNELTDAMKADVFSEAQITIIKCKDILNERL